MLLQVKDGDWPTGAPRKFPSRKYLPFSTLKSKLWGFFMILQLFLASIAWMKADNYLKPNPPWSLATHIFLQLIQWLLFLSPTTPHQNLAHNLPISLQIELGRQKQLIVYIEIAWATDLMSPSFPPSEKSFSFHPWGIFSILSLIFINTALLFLPTWEDIPRYCPKDSIVFIPSFFSHAVSILFSPIPWLSSNILF